MSNYLKFETVQKNDLPEAGIASVDKSFGLGECSTQARAATLKISLATDTLNIS